MAVLTKEGLQKLQEELDDLMVNQRAEVVREIEVAKGFGDLSENAEYSAAREKQSRIEGRILELQEMIEHAELIETGGEEGVANVGSVVKVFDMEYEEEDEYRIVGATEADPSKLFVSSESPIGAALIGSREGDVLEVETPGGLVKLRVISITQ
ncbi:MAG: transcription elongation factor GreA [Clostridia bacterium]|nr:transcription elongation factor GreA [Clostridia bacterium]